MVDAVRVPVIPLSSDGPSHTTCEISNVNTGQGVKGLGAVFNQGVTGLLVGKLPDFLVPGMGQL